MSDVMSTGLEPGQKRRILREAREEFERRLGAFLEAWRDGDPSDVSLAVKLETLQSVAGARESVEGLIDAWHAEPDERNTRRLAETLAIVCGNPEWNTASVYISRRRNLEYHGYVNGDRSSVCVATYPARLS